MQNLSNLSQSWLEEINHEAEEEIYEHHIAFLLPLQVIQQQVKVHFHLEILYILAYQYKGILNTLGGVTNELYSIEERILLSTTGPL